ncbi:cytochrome-c peroxidase [Commensalibacter communis]|uniref:cytochrome-c peroxidase n=1 Tax=Commensalibacter communis TaxID=2972786 RepID=UPI0022FF8F01|nr:cytochrome c peroxidase [Commensalibacter communis]CAI3936058.1 Cytochrome c peroxidase (MauG) (PDB:1EB7) [Commensalibacter communis]CAI3942157.1 Cytochrome c peroxidase (MauG) (PDB:1EB7) [Commensalibacter communis]
MKITAVILTLAISILSVCVYTVNAETDKNDHSVIANQVKLGRYLFYDADLSKDGSMSCATCHRQKQAFTDGNPTHPGVNNDQGIYNVPTLGNVGQLKTFTWTDQHVFALDKQALMPITGTTPVEMGMHHGEKEIEKRIASNACYVRLFNSAFPDVKGNKITIDTITQAIASFQRTLITDHSKWDTKQGYTKEMQQGEQIFFGKGQCATCHTPPLFTDQKFYQINKGTTKAMRTPTLRNIELTAPYFHDGSIETLKEAILAHHSDTIKLPHLSEKDMYDLIQFLNSLTDKQFINNPKFSLPAEPCE